MIYRSLDTRARCRSIFFFFFQAEDGIRDYKVTGVQTCALPICRSTWTRRVRSAPTSRGASTLSGIRVFTPGSTKNGARPKYFSHIPSSVCWTGGTTFEIATPWMSPTGIPRARRSVSMNTPYSSSVCSRRLVRTQDTRSRSRSKTPIFVFVLPTSATSSMVHLRRDLARDEPLHSAAVVHQERAVRVEADGDAADGVDRDSAPDRLAPREPALTHRVEPLSLEPRAPRVELLEQRLEHRVAVGRPAGLDHHGRRAVGELRRKGPLREVEAHANDHCNGGRGADTRRGWRAVGAAWLRTANARRVIVGRRWSAASRLHQDSRP